MKTENKKLSFKLFLGWNFKEDLNIKTNLVKK